MEGVGRGQPFQGGTLEGGWKGVGRVVRGLEGGSRWKGAAVENTKGVRECEDVLLACDLAECARAGNDGIHEELKVHHNRQVGSK